MGQIERINACKFLTIRLGNVYGAMGLMGNILAESGMNLIPNRMEMSWKKKTGWDDGWHNGVYRKELDTINPAINNGTYRNYRIDGDGQRRLATFKNDNCRDAFANDYIGYGLAQFTFNSRKYTLYDYAEKWCKEHCVPFEIGKLEMQLDFIVYELQKSYKSVLGVLMTTRDMAQASDVVCMYYERPQGYNIDEVKKTRRGNSLFAFNETFGKAYSQWFKYDGKWYYMRDGYVWFDKWILDGDKWYHLGTDGIMETNKWLLYDNKWYYVGQDGACLTNTSIVWQGKEYCFDDTGAMIVY